jgi:hypothetical protein
MPDGDRFERALRGPWRFPYRIAAAGASPELVADKLAASCLGLLTEEGVDCARKTLSALDAALAQSSMPLFFGEPQSSAFQRLVRGLESIAAEHGFDDFAQGCGRAASRCFIQLEESHQHVDNEQLEQIFAREVMGEIVGRNFFPIVRDRLVKNTGRDAVAQRAWEDNVMRCISGDIQKFSQALFASDTQRRTRRVRPSVAPSFDWNRLNQPLHVLGVH